MVLLPLMPSAEGGAPQRQDWLSPAGLMADGGGHGDPPGVEVPGGGGDGTCPLGGGSSVDDRQTSPGTTDAGARGQRTLFQPLPRGLDPTGTRHPAGAPSGSTPEVALSLAGTPYSGEKPPDVTTWGGGSVPPPAREPANRSSSQVPQVHGVPRVPRRAITAPGPTLSVPRPSGRVGDPLSVPGRGGRCQTRHGSLRVGALVVLPQSHGVPGMAMVSRGEAPWPRSFGLKSPDRWLRC